MSELERVTGEYYELLTKVVYDGLDGGADAIEAERLETLSDRMVELMTPDFAAQAA